MYNRASRTWAWTWVFGLISMTGCSDRAAPTVVDNLVPVASVTVSPAELTLQSGETASLTVTVRDAAGNVLTNRKVSWSTSNDNCVLVDATGALTALGPPGASIRALVGGISGRASITVVRTPR